MSTYVTDAGDINLDRAANVDLLFDSPKTIKGPPGTDCEELQRSAGLRISADCCEGYKHTSLPTDPPLTGVGIPQPGDCTPQNCLDTWENTVTGEAWILLEAADETTITSVDQSTIYHHRPTMNTSDMGSLGYVTFPYSMVNKWKAHADGTTDADGYVHSLHTNIFNQIKAERIGFWGGIDHGNPITITHWRSAGGMKPTMYYEVIGEDRPDDCWGDNHSLCQEDLRQYVWYTHAQFRQAPYTMCDRPFFISGPGPPKPHIQYSADPNYLVNDVPNQKIQYCPGSYPANADEDGWVYSGNDARECFALPPLFIYPLAGFTNAYEGKGFDTAAFLDAMKTGLGGHGFGGQTFYTKPCEPCAPGWQFSHDNRNCVAMVDETNPCTGNKRWVKLTKPAPGSTHLNPTPTIDSGTI